MSIKANRSVRFLKTGQKNVKAYSFVLQLSDNLNDLFCVLLTNVTAINSTKLSDYGLTDPFFFFESCLLHTCFTTIYKYTGAVKVQMLLRQGS